MRAAARRDNNEPEVVRALELAGWTVVRVSDTGFPDLVAVRRGVLRLLEVKGPKGELTEAQVKLHQRLAAAGLPVAIVRSPEEALEAVNASASDFRNLRSLAVPNHTNHRRKPCK